MADARALTYQSGKATEVGDADSLLVGAGIDRATAGSLTIGGTTATSITIGSSGVSPSFPGGIDLSGSDFTLDGVDIQWVDTGGALHTIDSVQAASDTVGSGLDVRAGQGGNSSTAPAQDGGSILVEGGTGGAGTNQLGGDGGDASLVGGTGGEATGGTTGGAGGAAYVTGGAGGNGGTSGDTVGGAVYVAGGAGQGSGADGTVNIGITSTSAVIIGATGVPLTVADIIQGPDDGTGVVIGHAGTTSSEGSTYQAVGLTTTQRGYLTAANGMIVYNTTDNQFQGFSDGGWVNLGYTGGATGGGWQDDGGTVRLVTVSDNVAVGIATMLGSEKLRVVGDTSLQGNVTFEADTSTPTIEHATITSGSPTELWVKAQSVSITDTQGSRLNLKSGDALAGNANGGMIRLRTGAGVGTGVAGEVRFAIGGDGAYRHTFGDGYHRFSGWTGAIQTLGVTTRSTNITAADLAVVATENNYTAGAGAQAGHLWLTGGSCTGGAGTTTGGNVNVDAGTGDTNGSVNIGGTSARDVNLGSPSNPVDVTITIDDNSTPFTVKEGSNEYIHIDTSDGAELLVLGSTTVANLTTGLFGSHVGIGTGANPATVGIDTPDNEGNAFNLLGGGNLYTAVDTTTGLESIEFGNATDNPDFSQLGSGQVSFAGDVAVGATTMYGTEKFRVVGDTYLQGSINFEPAIGTDAYITAPQATGAGVNGIDINVTGAKGADDATTPGGGGDIHLIVGAGGDSTGATTAGTGGSGQFKAGAGGDNPDTGDGGAGGTLFLAGGTGTTPSGTGAQGAGGNCSVRGGSGNPNGQVSIGQAQTSQINMGATGVPTIFAGEAQLETDALLRLASRSGDPTEVAGKGFVYSKNVSGIIELFYYDSNGAGGAAVQLTSNGSVNAPWTESGGVVYPDNTTDDVAIGATAMVGAEKLYVNGAVRIDGNVDATNGLDVTNGSLTLAGPGNSFSITGGSSVDWAIADDDSTAVQIDEGGRNYLTIDTSNGNENMLFGNATTNPAFAFAGGGTVSLQGVNQKLSLGGGWIGLAERVLDPTALVNEGVLYTKDVSTVTELFYRASDGTISQLTPVSGGTSPWTESSGVIYPNNTTDDVVIGATAMVGSEKLRVVGDTRHAGDVYFEYAAAERTLSRDVAPADTNNASFSFRGGNGGVASATSGGTGSLVFVTGGFGGDGTAGLPAGQGGKVTIGGGDAGTDNGGGSSVGGAVLIIGGSGSTGGNSDGGTVTIQGGPGIGTGSDGWIQFGSDNVRFTSSPSESLITKFVAPADTNAGNMAIRAGQGGAASAADGGDGGRLYLVGGNGGDGTATYSPGAGAQVSIAGGDAGDFNGGGVSHNGGAVTLIGGGGSVGGSGVGGDVVLQGGPAVGTGTRGKVRITPYLNISDGASAEAVLELTDGDSAANAPANHGRLRYNETTDKIERSENGGAYRAINTPDSVEQSNGISATTTTSTSDVIVSTMNFGTLPAGNYIVHFSSSWENDTNGALMWCSIYVGGTKVVHSERVYKRGNQTISSCVHTMAKVILSTPQQVDVRWRVNSGTGTMQVRSAHYMVVA
jgi:hypothetical protein